MARKILITFIVVLIVHVGLGHKAGAQIDVAYIYDSNLADANTFEQILISHGFSVDLIALADVADTDFSDYAVIIAGNDTGNSSSWGTPEAVEAIATSGKPVLGMGEGGYALLGKLVLDIGYPYGSHSDDTTSILVVDSNHPLFTMPYEISIPEDNLLQLYTSSASVEIHLGSVPPAHIVTLGQYPQGSGYYLIAVEDEQFMSWGFHGSPEHLTPTGEEVLINAVSFLHPSPHTLPQADKCTVKAGKKDNTDSLKMSGEFHATQEQLNAADQIEITIWSISGLEYMAPAIPFQPSQVKKGKFKYKLKVSKGQEGGVTAFSFDTRKQNFSLTVSKMSLTGLDSPLGVDIIIGDYISVVAVDEEIINGKKPIPMVLLRNYADKLRIDKVVCKQGKKNNVGNLVVAGAIATADDTDLQTASLLLHWGTAEHAVGLDEFELKGKTKYQYKKSPDDVDPANIVISIDPTKCTFQVVAKNTMWSWEDSPVTFGLEFGSFNETEEVTF